jgi:hypothetical protein
MLFPTNVRIAQPSDGDECLFKEFGLNGVSSGQPSRLCPGLVARLSVVESDRRVLIPLIRAVVVRHPRLLRRLLHLCR